MKGAEIIRNWESLQAQRLPLEYFIRQRYQYSFPLRGVQFGAGLESSPEEVQQQAAAMSAALYDSTATDACRILASTLVSGLTPANSRWFGLSAGKDAASEVKEWLDEQSNEIHKAIHASNYDSAGFEAMLDVVVAGWPALYIEEGEETDFVFEAWPLHACWFATTRRGGMVDTVFRHFTLTAQQAVREYGLDHLPEKIADAAQKNPYQRFPFIRAIFPKQFEPGAEKKIRDELLPFASYHVELGSKRIVRSGGVSEFPVVVPRWLKLPDSVYAEGPMQAALPDVKTLNEIERIILANADWQMSGMWGMADDGVMNIKTVKIGPRKVIPMKSKDSFFPINPPGRIEVGAIAGDSKRASIRRILMADQLESQASGPAKTATEVHYRVNLLRQLLGPMFGRLQAEYLQPLVFRCFGILLRKAIKEGKPIPEALRSRKLMLQYISPLARAQSLEDVAAMDRFEEGLLAKAEAIPGTLDLYNWDEAERKRGEYLGVPASLILDDKKVAALRKMREDRQAKESQAAQQAELAKKQGGNGMAPGMLGLPAAQGVTGG